MLNPINPNKVGESIPDRVVTHQQKVDFNSFLIEFKRQQLDAMSGLLGGEKETQTDPLGGYHRILLDSLASQLPAGVNGKGNNFDPQKIVKQYQAVSHDAINPVSQSKSTVRDLVLSAAQKHGITEQWFEKLIGQESAFDPSAVSPKGAMGLGQLMPATAKDLGLRITTDKGEGSVWNPASNLDASARYLRRLYDRYAGMGIEDDESKKFAAAAYNAGMGNIQKAMDKLDDEAPLTWDNVAKVLPEVTGKASRETLRYVENLQA